MSDTPTNNASGLRPLPKGFSPSINEVIIGRGRRVTNHSGNERFRDLIYSEIKEYARAENKTAKSAIIFRVLQQIKDGSPHTGGFVKQISKTKQWFACESTVGRTTTAQAFRDALSSSYKSSKQFKQQRRWDRKMPPSPTTTSTPAPKAEEVPALDIAVEVAAPKIPVMPTSFQPFAAFPALARRPQPFAPSNHLGDILHSALETVEDLSPFPTGSMDQLPVLTTTGGEQGGNREVDFDKLVDLLGVHPTASSNPFEPTPISPGVAQVMPPLRAGMAGEKEQYNGWENKMLRQFQDNAFCQDNTSTSDQAFSLRQALSSCRQFQL